MRTCRPDTRPCESCGRKTGSLWVPYAKVLDFGVPTMPPLEPNMMEPKRCDDCEMLARLADPEYRALCWPRAEEWEQQALANGGKKPNG